MWKSRSFKVGALILLVGLVTQCVETVVFLKEVRIREEKDVGGFPYWIVDAPWEPWWDWEVDLACRKLVRDYELGSWRLHFCIRGHKEVFARRSRHWPI
jgi:hypothetical protein